MTALNFNAWLHSSFTRSRSPTFLFYGLTLTSPFPFPFPPSQLPNDQDISLIHPPRLSHSLYFSSKRRRFRRKKSRRSTSSPTCSTKPTSCRRSMTSFRFASRCGSTRPCTSPSSPAVSACTPSFALSPVSLSAAPPPPRCSLPTSSKSKSGMPTMTSVK